jgi:putative peptide chain release factor H
MTLPHPVRPLLATARQGNAASCAAEIAFLSGWTMKIETSGSRALQPTAPVNSAARSAGMGPHEVRAFVAHLADRLEHECALRGLHVADVVTVGDPDAPSSVAIHVSCQGAPASPASAVLADLVGTHALVARSRDRGRRARKRWFAGVSVHPAPRADAFAPAALDPADVEITAARAGGPGGQHVNRTASAVRAVHRPTGIAVRVTDERSQHANRKRALTRLAAILAARAREHRDRQRAARRDAHYRFARGNPVRTWRLAERPGRAGSDMHLVHDEE